jgi:hypothetical protein
MLSGERWYERCCGSLVGGGVSHAARLVRDAGATTRSQAERCSSRFRTQREGWPDHGNEPDRHWQTNPTRPPQFGVRTCAGPPSTLEETEIKRIFGEALAAQPSRLHGSSLFQR